MFFYAKPTTLASLKAQVAITMAAQGPFPDTAKVGHAIFRGASPGIHFNAL